MRAMFSRRWSSEAPPIGPASSAGFSVAPNSIGL
jgi:hypothetical protein